MSSTDSESEDYCICIFDLDLTYSTGITPTVYGTVPSSTILGHGAPPCGERSEPRRRNFVTCTPKMLNFFKLCQCVHPTGTGICIFLEFFIACTPFTGNFTGIVSAAGSGGVCPPYYCTTTGDSDSDHYKY
jgi:hypothetical protein